MEIACTLKGVMILNFSGQRWTTVPWDVHVGGKTYEEQWGSDYYKWR